MAKGSSIGKSLNVGAGIFIVLGAIVLVLWLAQRAGVLKGIGGAGAIVGVAPGGPGPSTGGGQFGPDTSPGPLPAANPTAARTSGPRSAIDKLAVLNPIGQAPAPVYTPSPGGFTVTGSNLGMPNVVGGISATNVLKGYLDPITGTLFANPTPGGIAIYG